MDHVFSRTYWVFQPKIQHSCLYPIRLANWRVSKLCITSPCMLPCHRDIHQTRSERRFLQVFCWIVPWNMSLPYTVKSKSAVMNEKIILAFTTLSEPYQKPFFISEIHAEKKWMISFFRSFFHLWNPEMVHYWLQVRILRSTVRFSIRGSDVWWHKTS